jgi:Fe-Mn family superoxide dismutase
LNRRKFIQISGLGFLAAITVPGLLNAQPLKGGKAMYTAKDYSKLIGMEGFSEILLKNHFTLYQGYVTNTNKILDSLAQMLKEDKASTPEWAELKRRLGWEFNGMRLHEYYFENP